MSDDLQLNSLDRFSKNSDRLILEEHSSCEVPAGCGGVVMRWRNPNDGLPVVFYGNYAAKSEVLVDGQLVPSSRTIIPVGEHSLAIKLTEIGSPRLFIWWTELDIPREDNIYVLSATTTPDSGWKMSQDVHEDDLRSWALPGFDDETWSTMSTSGVDIETLGDDVKWRYQIREGYPYTRFDLPPSGGTVWIRKRFVVEEPAL